MERETVILELFRAGFHHRGMSLLMDLYGNEVYGWLMGILKNEDDAKDAAQEVFIKAYRSLKDFRGDSSLKTWLFTVGRNTAFSYMKTRHYRSSSLDSSIPDSAVPQEISPDMRKNRIYPFMNKLSLTLRTPLTMYYYMGCTYTEIAHILDSPLNTVKAQIRRGKITLLKTIRREFPDFNILHSLEE